MSPSAMMSASSEEASKAEQEVGREAAEKQLRISRDVSHLQGFIELER